MRPCTWTLRSPWSSDTTRSSPSTPARFWVPTRALAGGLLYEGDDGLRSASAPGLAWLALPAVVLADLFTPAPRPRFDALFAGGAPRAVVAPLQHDPRVIAFVLLGPLSAALAAAFLVLAARALGLSRPATILAVAALALGSPFFPYAGTSWTQLPTAAALAYLLYRLSAREARPGSGVAGIGVAAAVAILVRPDHLLFVVVAVAVLYRIDRGWRRSPSRSLARVLPLFALACGALSLWGLPANGGGWSLAEVPAGLVGLLFSPRTGLLFYAPIVVLLPLGLTRLPRPIAWLIVGWLLAAILVYAGWFDWGASLAYGPRFFVPLLPALALAFGAAVDALPERRRVWAWLPVVLGFAVELPGALLHPRPHPRARAHAAPHVRRRVVDPPRPGRGRPARRRLCVHLRPRLPDCGGAGRPGRRLALPSEPRAPVGVTSRLVRRVSARRAQAAGVCRAACSTVTLGGADGAQGGLLDRVAPDGARV